MTGALDQLTVRACDVAGRIAAEREPGLASAVEGGLFTLPSELDDGDQQAKDLADALEAAVSPFVGSVKYYKKFVI